MRKKLSSNGLLYLIIDKQITDRNNKNLLKLAEDLSKTPLDLIQLRAKDSNDFDFLSLAKKLSRLFKKAKKSFIVNDRPDIAYLAEADGLHLGQSDIPVNEAKKIIGEEKVLGKTIHCLKELINTNQNQIDYLGIGPFFASKTKKNNRNPLKNNEIKQMLAKSKKVIFAIGGITRYNIDSVLKYNIKNVAVSSAVLLSPNPGQEIKEIKKCLKKVS
ncbi:MAG: thiamine phosphate synthase [Candidatus Omnitrophica bacterium]|nr:thiamine phosphate synthase [Candidatus Omnitrophota bacterium]MCF7897930.1 thiamine phosphate synthase [Candidatus Omnitrophota bacterium]MCF7909009.1 thiamine phosphate synthase [Candidatus Omnitrophota bacterium]